MMTVPVYAGKSMVGLVDLVARADIERSANVLGARLGGQPAINSMRAQLAGAATAQHHSGHHEALPSALD
jgi:hypothetical protein